MLGNKYESVFVSIALHIRKVYALQESVQWSLYADLSNSIRFKRWFGSKYRSGLKRSERGFYRDFQFGVIIFIAHEICYVQMQLQFVSK